MTTHNSNAIYGNENPAKGGIETPSRENNRPIMDKKIQRSTAQKATDDHEPADYGKRQQIAKMSTATTDSEWLKTTSRQNNNGNYGQNKKKHTMQGTADALLNEPIAHN